MTTFDNAPPEGQQYAGIGWQSINYSSYRICGCLMVVARLPRLTFFRNDRSPSVVFVSRKRRRIPQHLPNAVRWRTVCARWNSPLLLPESLLVIMTRRNPFSHTQSNLYDVMHVIDEEDEFSNLWRDLLPSSVLPTTTLHATGIHCFV